MCNLLFSLISYRLQANGMWFLHKDFHSFCEFCWLRRFAMCQTINYKQQSKARIHRNPSQRSPCSYC